MMLLLHIVLLALPSLVGCCVPMKTPSPGIPAGKSCKLFVPDVTGCQTQFLTCKPPDVLTATSIACPAAYPRRYMFAAGLAGQGLTYTSAVCDAVTGEWTVTTGAGVTSPAPAQFTNIACF